MMCLNLIDLFMDKFRDDKAKINRQIDCFTLEFQNIIPDNHNWDAIREDITTVLNFYLPSLLERKDALQESLNRVKAKLRELQASPVDDGVIKNTTFALENKKLLAEKIQETDKQIRFSIDYLTNLEASIVVCMDDHEPSDKLLKQASTFTDKIQLTGLEDTRVREDITTEIDGFKQEKGDPPN